MGNDFTQVMGGLLLKSSNSISSTSNDDDYKNNIESSQSSAALYYFCDANGPGRVNWRAARSSAPCLMLSDILTA